MLRVAARHDMRRNNTPTSAVKIIRYSITIINVLAFFAGNGRNLERYKYRGAAEEALNVFASAHVRHFLTMNLI